jgi:hypothetical protein
MRSEIQSPPRAVYAGIVLISAATLLLQVAFTRIFSVSIWYHFAFLVVSVALFGFGASGVALSLIPDQKADARRRGWTPALFGLSALGWGACCSSCLFLTWALPDRCSCFAARFRVGRLPGSRPSQPALSGGPVPAAPAVSPHAGAFARRPG